MCGLAGCWHRDDRAANIAVLAPMLDRQRHRGPDDRGTWAEGPIALGLDRLSILDLSSHGHQPFVTPDGTSAVAYNGEVYNWRALQHELELEGVRFTSQCDTEVVLHALPLGTGGGHSPIQRDVRPGLVRSPHGHAVARA